jgi:hypothetical protein
MVMAVVDLHMRPPILDNVVLVPATANLVTFTDEEIWGLQGRFSTGLATGISS